MPFRKIAGVYVENHKFIIYDVWEKILNIRTCGTYNYRGLSTALVTV